MSACPMCRMRPCRCFMGRQAKTLAQSRQPASADPAAIKLLIMENNEALRLAVAVGVGAYLAYGVMSSMSSNAPSLHIENVHNSVITVGAKVGLSGEDIETVLQSTPDKMKLAEEKYYVFV